MPNLTIPEWATNLSEVLAGVFLASYLGYIGFKNKLKVLFPDKKIRKEIINKEYEKAFNDISAIYTEMQDTLADLGASRILILYTENGGGIPNPLHHLHSSVLYEVTNGSETLKRSWQKQLIDADYSKMIANLASGEQLNVLDIEKDLTNNKSMLKVIFEALNAKAAVIVRITATPSKFYYLNVMWDQKINEDDLPKVQLSINSLVNFLQEKLK